MDHVHYSDGTEGTQLREFLARQNDNSPLDDAPSPRTALLSTSESDVTPPEPRARASLRHRHTRERKTVEPGLSRRDLMRALIEHEREFKELKRAYSIALDRVETETQRASLAEQRALDLAVRLREATDLRLHAERDLARTREEINLYKMQYDVAQREIHRAQDIVKDVEARREDAEAAATRARGVARKLREERMIYVAREEGRRQGYQEGLSRGRRMGYDEGTELGYEEGMGETRGVSEGNYSRFIEEVGSDDEYRDEYADDGEDDRRHGRDDGGSVDFPHMVNFPGRTRTEDERLTPPSATPTVFVPVSTHPSSTGRASIPPSRTRVRVENRTPVPVPPVSAPPLPPTNPAPIAPQPVTQQPLAAPSPTRPAIIRPVSVHNAPPSPRHPEYSIPPDGWIPLLDAQNRIVIPPPHEFSRPASPLPPPSPSVTGSLGLPPPPAPSSQGFPPMGQPRDQRGPPSNPVGFSQLSYQQSNASSRDLRNHPLDRVSGLSTIQEANTETPSVRANGGRRSATPSRGQPFMAYSIPPTDGSNSPRSRDVNQRLANGLRYTDGTPVEWSHMPLENHQPPPYAMQPTTSQGGPQRRRPANLTIPAPLATPAATPSDAPRHRRSASAASGGTAPTNTSSFLGRHRRAASSGNSVPDINVAPPSNSASDTTRRSPQHVATLSPNMGSRRQLSEGTHGQRSAVSPMRSPRPGSTALPDGRFSPITSPDDVPNAWQQQQPWPIPVPSHSPIPVPAPNLPTPISNVYVRPSSVLPIPPPNGQYSSSRPITPQSGYQNYYVPPKSPNTPVERIPPPASPSQSATSSRILPKRNLSLNAGSTPGMRQMHLGLGPNQLSRRASNASLGSQSSYGRFDTREYQDPAFLASPRM